MIKKVLIANRSEIACRIIRACREMQIASVAVYSEADSKALHVTEADQAVAIGPAVASESYLNQDAVINAALESGCDAIHPGYGFLAENPEFNKKVRQAGLTFIGPDPEPMRLLGSKVESRKTMIEANVPVIPGMKGSSDNIEDFKSAALEMGFPVLIKASAGGGGKGMRVVNNVQDLEEAVNSAKREALSAFGSDEVFLEKYIEQPRHIEFQVACDHHGNALHLFERECSIQRRHQKIIEETPSTSLTPELRQEMGKAAVKAVQVSGYDSVGTVEFLLDKDGSYYFLEVNTRIQVEHPISEMVTGIDLVKLQIDIADGKHMPFTQEDLSQHGHAIECRIYAEDADKNFMPSSGDILLLREPGGTGVRFDSGIYEGAQVPVFYDPVLAKLICWGNNREEARRRMLLALKDTVVLGVKTSIPFMMNVLDHDAFIEGDTYTNFIDSHSEALFSKQDKYLNEALACAALSPADRNGAMGSGGGSKIDIGLATPWQTVGKWEICGGTK